MGTRNLTCVVIDGEIKVAQYGQWDGYPSGAGIDIVDFIRGNEESAELRSLFVERLRQCQWITEEEWKQQWADCGADIEADNGFVEIEIGKKHAMRYPDCNRDTGSNILRHIRSGSDDPHKLQNSIDFVKDSLFCEWAYVLDMDNEVLEIYEGFNHEPVPDDERFACYNDTPKEGVDGTKYYPVKLIKTYCFHNLPATNDIFVDEVNEASREYRGEEEEDAEEEEA